MATVTINTKELGKLSRTALKKKVKSAGSSAALARRLEIPSSTVRSWRWRLNAKVAK